jgi:hypothetical protein
MTNKIVLTSADTSPLKLFLSISILSFIFGIVMIFYSYSNAEKDKVTTLTTLKENINSLLITNIKEHSQVADDDSNDDDDIMNEEDETDNPKDTNNNPKDTNNNVKISNIKKKNTAFDNVKNIKKHTEVDNNKLMETIYIVELYNLTNRIANINNNRYYWTEDNRKMYNNGMILLIGSIVFIINTYMIMISIKS